LRDGAIGEDEAGGNRPPGARDELKPREQEHHAKRREKVGDAQAHDEQSIDEADCNACHKSERYRRGRAELQHDHRVA
jgi:hypothetical protein